MQDRDSQPLVEMTSPGAARSPIPTEGTSSTHNRITSTGDLAPIKGAREPQPGPFRLKIISFVEHPWFDPFIVLVILSNCVFLALDDPSQDCANPCSSTQEAVENSEYVFLAIYCVEMILKLIAYQLDYFRSPWNWLDFIVVILSFLSLIPSVGKYQALRTMRLLRTLRSFSSIPSLKKVVTSLLDAIPLLMDVLLLSSFVLMVFAVFGLQLFMGKLRQYCADTSGNFPDDLEACSFSSGHGAHNCDPNGAYPVCTKGTFNMNPGNGMVNFDHFGYAFLTVFQLSSGEGWTDVLYQTEDTTTDWAILYYLLILWIGTLIVISLVFAAIEATWSDEDEETEAQLAEKEPNFAERMDVRMRSWTIVKWMSGWTVANTELGKTCYAFVTTQFFEWLVFYAIVANTIVLALNRRGISEDEQDALDLANEVLTYFFVGEMLLKITSYGIVDYLKDKMNRFDMFVVIVSLLELGLVSSSMFSVFRALRLLRLLKLVRSWRSLRLMVDAMLASIKASASVCVVLLVFIVIFALFGKEFFGNKFDVNDERYNYDDFWAACMSVFVVLSSENWNALMYEAGLNAGRGFAVYFVAIIVIGNYVILQIFIAIILEQLVSVIDEEDGPVTKKDEDMRREEAWIVQSINRAMGKKRTMPDMQMQSIQEDGQSGETPLDPKKNKMSINLSHPKVLRTREERLRAKFDHFDTDGSGWINEKEVKDLLEHFKIELTMLEYHVMFADDRFTFDEFLDLMDKYEIEVSEDGMVTSRLTARAGKFTNAEMKMLRKFDLDPTIMVTQDMGSTDEIILEGKSLYWLSVSNPFRIQMKSIANDKRFQRMILVCIILSTISVALDEPGRSKSFQDTLGVFDMIFTCIFILELVIKVLAMGFVMGKHSYLRSSHFNKLDFVVVALSFVTFFLNDGSGGSEVSSLKALRAFRALRPLRTVGRIANLKIVVNALMQSAMPVLNALGLLGFFFLMFAILGVNIYSGKFSYCQVTDTPAGGAGSLPSCPETDFASGMCGAVRCRKSDCFDCFDTGAAQIQNRSWTTYDQNFDNVINAMVVLFSMSTLDGWPVIALQAIDSTGSNTWPDENYERAHFLYFVLFVIVGAFFVVNLFASVAVDKYGRMQEFYSGMLFLTEKQKVWVIDSKQVIAAKPTKLVTTPLIQSLEKFVLHPWFDAVIIGCILANIVVLSVAYEGMPQSYEDTLNIFNIIFVAIFGLEMLLKILGLGPVPYVLDHWNKFDGTIVILSIISLTVDLGGVASVFRIFRIARILKLVPRAERLMAVVQTVYLSLPALGNVGALTTLFFVIYACLGVSLFGTTVHGDCLNEHANFETFPMAMLTLFRVATGDNWSCLIYDLAISKGEINSAGNTCSSAEDNCGLNVVAQIYLISFVVLTAFMMLNMVLAAVVAHFELCKASNEGLSDSMINRFKAAWFKYDPDAIARIQAQDFPALYKDIHGIFDFPAHEMEKYYKKCSDTGGELKFTEVLFVFAFERFGATLGVTKKGRELETKIESMKVKLDEEPRASEKPILPQLTEWQLETMSPEELREQLRSRGHVRVRNRGMSSAEGLVLPAKHQRHSSSSLA